MPRATTLFVCSDCGGEALRWSGQCPHCRAWNTLQEFRAPSGGSRRAGMVPPSDGAVRAVPLIDVPDETAARIPLEWPELNRVLGGGVVAGGVVLIGGEPGVGKSTLLMHLAAQVAARAGTVLYASGEESAQQVRMRAARMGVLHQGLMILAGNDLDAIIAEIERIRPVLAIVDSVQTVADAGVDSAAGSVVQVRESAARLMRVAKSTGVPVFLVGHVTKEGAIAGPRLLEHIVDTVLYLEGDREHEFRILRATKNRFGSVDEIGMFTMGDGGLLEVADPAGALLGERRGLEHGTAVVAALEGTRPLLVEIQSLSSETEFPPRRVANGVDFNRLQMILAVLASHAKVRFGKRDVFVSAGGGLRVTEPGADLAIALSLASDLAKTVIRPGIVVFGELALTGEVRRVRQQERRISEAARRGFDTAIVPAGGAAPGAPLRVVEVATLKEALDATVRGLRALEA